MLADGASTSLEDMEMPRRERQAAATAMDGWSRHSASQGSPGSYGVLAPNMQGGNMMHMQQQQQQQQQQQHQAQFTWRGLGEGQMQAGVQAQGGQFAGMGRRPLADCNAALLDFNSVEAPTLRGSATPGGHVYTAPGWHSMVPDASAVTRGTLRGTDVHQGRPHPAHAAAQSSGPGWGGQSTTSHWWAAGVTMSSPPRAGGGGLSSSAQAQGGPGQMFQGGMPQGFSADSDEFAPGVSNLAPTTQSACDASGGSAACGSQEAESPAERWGAAGSWDGKGLGGSTGRSGKRRRPPSLSCIETTAATEAAAQGEDCFSFGNLSSRRRVEQGEEGALSPDAVGDGWMTPQPAAQPDAWTPTGAGAELAAEALARGDSWTFSMTPRTPRDLALQVT
jgi:hypothetical protein